MNFPLLPPAAELADLTPQQASFLIAYIELGGRKGGATEAALAAGYGNGSPESAKHRARDLLRNPRILSALRAELSNRFSAAAVLGLSTLVELCQSGPPGVRLQAAKELCDRGYGPIISRNATVTAQVRIEDLLAELDEAERRQPFIDVNPIDRGTETEPESTD
jgi:Terminase small subunit